MAAVRSTIVCPACGHRESEIIPEDACQYFYQCKGCRVIIPFADRVVGTLTSYYLRSSRRFIQSWRVELVMCEAVGWRGRRVRRQGRGALRSRLQRDP